MVVKDEDKVLQEWDEDDAAVEVAAAVEASFRWASACW